MEDRIVFPAEAIEDAGKRLRRIALALDDLSGMLRAAERSIDLDSLKRAAVLDELTRYVKRLLLASEEAQRIGKALDQAWESFVECEESTTQNFLRIRASADNIVYNEKNLEKTAAHSPFSGRNIPRV